uniref:G-patch domain-containing protein n=1 Tax=Odontella aurita TaxID=265563 RepID=A0A7S4J9T4_9STRA
MVPTAQSGAKSEKKKFAISLKSKKLGKSSRKSFDGSGKEGGGDGKESDDQEEPAVLALPAKVVREHEADMEKWSARGREICDEASDRAGVDGPKKGDVPAPHGNDAGKSSHLAASTSKPLPDPNKVAKTPDGKPICLLCRRKFPSLEKLRQHERVSALHKQNLAKKKAAEAAEKKNAVPAPPSADYRDRAKERRALFGPDAAPASAGGGEANEEPPAALGPSLDKARAVHGTEAVAPQESLGESNIGNKMLQKLGWKTGGALGRKMDSSVSADGSNGAAGGGVQAKDTLRADWERIESMAGAHGRNGQRGEGLRSAHQ